MARGPPLLGLLLLLLCSQVGWATSSPVEDEVEDGVRCPLGHARCARMQPYMDQPNNEKEYKKYDLECGRNEHWDPDSQRCVCNDGYFKGANCPEFCDLRIRCENHKSPGPGSTRNGLPKWLKYFIALLVILPVVFCLCYKYRDQLRVWCAPCISYFQHISDFRDWKQPQGQLQDVSGPDPRNSFELRTVLVDVNGQYKPKETHSLLPGENSDPATDSAISVVPEVMRQSRSSETPPPAQVTLEQEP